MDNDRFIAVHEPLDLTDSLPSCWASVVCGPVLRRLSVNTPIMRQVYARAIGTATTKKGTDHQRSGPTVVSDSPRRHGAGNPRDSILVSESADAVERVPPGHGNAPISGTLQGQGPFRGVSPPRSAAAERRPPTIQGLSPPRGRLFHTQRGRSRSARSDVPSSGVLASSSPGMVTIHGLSPPRFNAPSRVIEGTHQTAETRFPTPSRGGPGMPTAPAVPGLQNRQPVGDSGGCWSVSTTPRLLLLHPRRLRMRLRRFRSTVQGSLSRPRVRRSRSKVRGRLRVRVPDAATSERVTRLASSSRPTSAVGGLTSFMPGVRRMPPSSSAGGP